MKKRIFRSILITALIVMLVTSVSISLLVYRIFDGQSMNDLRSEASTICHGLRLAADETVFLSTLDSEHRITLVDETGAVLFDSSANSERMENHADRPEIVSALQSGTGESRRYSDTLSQETFYFAQLTPAGNVLRISGTQDSIFGIMMNMLPILLVMLCVIAVVLLMASRRITSWIVAPINSLNLNHPLENEAYDELAPLLGQLDRQKQEIHKHISKLNTALIERNAITENMREGLILLNSKGEVLTINASAAKIFEVQAQAGIGKNILSISRDASLHDACRQAHAGNSADVMLEKGGRYFRVFASPVLQEHEQIGVVLLMLDVTDGYNAEISRREFTANVSHELKTPLTAISGYAEIIRDGVARPEDIKTFAERIYKETSRLIALLGDIFELARLDEQKGLGEKETVILMEVVKEAASRLENAAGIKHIHFTIEGEGAVVGAYRSLLVEMCYNLIDNAVRYTPEGGDVQVTVGYKDGRPYVSVKDTGIGIAPEHQQHIFERFYRVDKSRSKASGGTGLGLAIVKHGALIHGAEIELDSAADKGTEIKIIF